MNISRRKFLLGLGLMAAGCSSSNHVAQLPPPSWPGEQPYYRPSGGYSYGGSHASASAPQLTPYDPLESYSAPPLPPRRPRHIEANPPTVRVAGALQAIPRSRWTDAYPIMSRILAMDGVSRITIHHEGWTPVTFTDTSSTAERLEQIRQSHLERLHAGDIAYHYVIDRAGRTWQGRDVRYQGAHVRDENEHNLGVMVLGNFEKQDPTVAQLTTLHRSIHQLMAHYRVPIHRVYTHRELARPYAPTLCPGLALQPRVAAMRSRYFA